MSKGKHTPGPWTRGPKPENGMPLIVAPESNRVVLGYKEPNYDDEGWYVVDDEDLALMIAAPDMLEALVFARQFVVLAAEHRLNGALNTLEFVDAALAKARGEADA